jgi:hypothetical protein
MDKLTLVSNLASSLAWPVSAFFCVFLLRKSLRGLIDRLREIKHGDSSAGFETFVSAANTTSLLATGPTGPEPTELAGPTGPAGPEPTELAGPTGPARPESSSPVFSGPRFPKPMTASRSRRSEPAYEEARRSYVSGELESIIRNHLMKLAITSPRLAVVEAWNILEESMLFVAEKNGLTLSNSSHATSRGVLLYLLKRNLIDATLFEVILDLKNARNAAVHLNDKEVSLEKAADFVITVERVQQALYSGGSFRKIYWDERDSSD